jgi:NAD(P)-dependent dehydrogenase (short-subunit alcohol dehydrogenase family)
MIIRKLLVIGSSSYIASSTVPMLNFERSDIFSLDRYSQKNVASSYVNEENRYFFDSSDTAEMISALENVLSKIGKSRVMILNFIGSLGDLSTENLNLQNIFYTFEVNMRPNLILANQSLNLQSGSLILSFSGAGIGGQNLDDSSLGYLSAKASLAVLVEVFDRQSAPKGVRFGLIAPGAHPSRMQKEVAVSDAKHIPSDRKADALHLLNHGSNTENLVNTLEFLRIHPELAGGRIWSAAHDTLSEDFVHSDFGKLRRIF